MSDTNTVGTNASNEAATDSGSLETAIAAIDALLTGNTGKQSAAKSKPTPKAEAVEAADEDEEDDASETQDDSEEDDSSDEDSEQAEEEESEDSEEPLIKVTVNGKTEEKPLTEVVALAQKGLDYTKKTEALSAERKAFTAEAEQVRAERQQYGQMIGQLEQMLAQALPQEPDWNRLQRENPQEFLMQREIWRDHLTRLDMARQEQARLGELEFNEQKKAIEEFTKQERIKLYEAVPEWKDSKKWNAARDQMLEYGQKAGFSIDELKAATDSRIVLALHKAAQYDALMNNKPKANKPNAQVIKPGNASSPKSVAARDTDKIAQRLAKTGSPRDAEAIFDRMFRK
jgi:hypothetical protein